MCSSLLRLLSWRSWGVIRYNAIFQNATAVLYLELVYSEFSWAYLGRVALFALLSLLSSSYGYLVNDFADRELDRQHGKDNVFAGSLHGFAGPVVGLSAGLSLLISTPFWNRPGFLIIFIIWLMLATFYSLPPLRLKVRGTVGLATTVLAQHTLPGLLLFAALGRFWSWETLIFTLYITCRGCTSDVSHQMRDWANDVRTNTQTAAVRHGYAWITHLYAWALEAEKLGLGFVMVLLVLRIPTLQLAALPVPIPLATPLLMLYVILYCLTGGRAWGQRARGELIDPHDPSRQAAMRDRYQIIHHSFPSVVSPLYLALLATAYFWPNILLLLAIIGVFRLWSPQLWSQLWRGWAARHKHADMRL
jgi:4-hydroxybenzoate polyprenyltransferase